jgi:hypothetical protein
MAVYGLIFPTVQLNCYFLFTQFMLQYVGPSLDRTSFDQLVLHISNCIKIYQRSRYLRRRADLFAEVFESCDSAKVGTASF